MGKQEHATPNMQRLPKRSVSFWSVQAILYTETITIKNTQKHIKRHPTVSYLNQPSAEREGSEAKTVVYREYLEQLMKMPKILRDQIIIELPILQAFRTGEVSSFHAEYADPERGDITVLDSKTLKLVTLPMDATVAKHIDQYINESGITQGVLIRALPNAPHKGRKQGGRTPGDPEGLSTNYLADLWAKYCVKGHLPILTPREGRAGFAVKWHFTDHKSVYGLMVMMRHTNLRVTQRYLEHHIDYRAVKAEFNQGQLTPFSLSSQCRFSSGCPLAAPGCRCRMFQESFEVKQTA